MIQSKEGSKIVNDATKMLNPNFFSLHPNNDDEDDQDAQREPVDFQKLFPEIRPLAESIVEATPKKLKYDEEQIAAKLIAKYGENYEKMSKDIKINYLQWSVG